ncbi:MAG TPA: DUF4214 domain-containing protein [Epsilonproteobacteria bacterium]|nr:DUF4214 domain-containing protein [Campylobacterota bacterium]
MIKQILDEIDEKYNVACLDIKQNPKKYIRRKKLHLVMDSEDKFRQKDVYIIEDFNRYFDTEFIRNLYLGLLRREPEEAGLEEHVTQLRSGARTKTEILLAIRYSKEGRQKAVKILGLKKRYAMFTLFRIPFLGSLLKHFYYLATLSRQLRRLNRLENYVGSELQAMKKFAHESQKHINKKLDIDEFEILMDASR